MAQTSPLLRLSNELLRSVLDYIEADPNKLVHLDRRGYLSQESFAIPAPPLREQARDIGNLRQTCRRLAELGAIHQYARVSIRFSHAGFARLEWLAGQKHIAKHIRKLSYLIPNFYGRSRIHDVLPMFDASLGHLDARHFTDRIIEHKEILGSQEDLRALRKAAAAFHNLQHVQILRLLDEKDSALIHHLRQHEELAELVELQWPPACQRGTKTISQALMETNSPCSRFSSPMASGLSAVPRFVSKQLSKGNFQVLTANLTSLELHFDDNADLDDLISGLSQLFQELFSLAVNMQSIHIGFPSHRPLGLPLEQVFHDIRWAKLSAFGIQAWKLDAGEIINLVRRHRDRLRGLRLRDVLLNEGSEWKEVLRFLHDEMPQLDWVSLRRIGYTKFFEEQWTGAEIPDDPPGGDSDSSEEEEEEEEEDDEDQTANENEDREDDSDGQESFATHSDDGDHEDEQAHGMSFPTLPPHTSPHTRRCHSCAAAVAHDIDNDDGVFVTNTQRKQWEKWVVHRRTRS